MKVSDWVETIAYGDLRNLSFGEEYQETGTLSDKNEKTMLVFLNQGLKMLSTRATLKKDEVIIRTRPNVSLYELRPEHSLHHGTDPLKYLIDTPEKPFTGDVIKVLEIYSEIGRHIPLNNRNVDEGAFTPQFDVVQLTHPGVNNHFSVMYRAYHPVITGMDDEINLPPSLEEALTAYVTAKVFGTIDTESGKLRSQEEMQKFQQLCNEVPVDDFTGESMTGLSNKLRARGFV